MDERGHIEMQNCRRYVLGVTFLHDISLICNNMLEIGVVDDLVILTLLFSFRIGLTIMLNINVDIYLLLKSSDFILHDLKNQENAEQKYELVLRKWCNLHSSMEFRCFVYNNKLGRLTKMHTHLESSCLDMC